MIEEKKHSRVGASSAKRFLNCPGSVELSKDIPNVSSRFAIEGQNAHAFAEFCLEHKLNPAQLSVEDLDGIRGALEICIDDEMVQAIQEYVDVIEGIKKQFPKAKWEVEKKFHLDFIDKEAFGTCDFVLHDDFGVIHVTDLKYGAGLFVDVIENEQLAYYAVGAAWDHSRNCFHDYEFVELTIVQPRAGQGPWRKYRFPAKELERWAETFKKGIEATRIPGAPLNSGDWCQFCPAKPQCPKLHEKVLYAMSNEVQNPMLLSDEQLLKLIENKGAIESFLKKVYESALLRAVNGNPIPGTKLVRGKGKRVWADEKQAEEILRTKYGADAYTVELKTPPAMEKVKGVKKGEINPLTATIAGKIQLVPEHDARPPIFIGEIDFDSEVDI